ncbi:MAG: DUF1761 domain-containing protein [Bacteroidota bacterium]
MDLGTAFGHINWLSVLAATASAFGVGGLWYGPLLGRSWMVEFDVSQADLKSRSLPKTFGLSFLLALLAAVVLEMFIGAEADWKYGALAGFLVGFGWVASLLGILYLFEMKSLKAYFINAGYCVVSLTLMGGGALSSILCYSLHTPSIKKESPLFPQWPRRSKSNANLKFYVK